MRVFLLLFSITIAVLAITFRDTLTNIFLDNNITSFKSLSLIPLRAIYGAPKTANMTIPRAIRKSFEAIEQSEGVGARVRRSIGTPQRRLSEIPYVPYFGI